MRGLTLNDEVKYHESYKMHTHKNLIRQVGIEQAIRTIKKDIPEGLKLKEYLEQLQDEIAKEDALRNENLK